MFDPNYINEVLSDILNRKTGGEWVFTLTPEEPLEELEPPKEEPA